MHVTIACQHTTLTDSIRDAVHQKINKLDEHTEFPLSAHVILTVERHAQSAEATVLINGTPLHAKATSDNVYKALDKLVLLLGRAMRKEKTRKLRDTRGAVAGLKTYGTS